MSHGEKVVGVNLSMIKIVRQAVLALSLLLLKHA